MVWQVMESFNFDGVDLLIIENVGNFVCFVFFDFGEDYCVMFIVIMEGDDKFKKYLWMFFISELMLVFKVDFLEYLFFFVDNVVVDVWDINLDIDVMELFIINGIGVDVWCNWLLNKVVEKKEVVFLVVF